MIALFLVLAPCQQKFARRAPLTHLSLSTAPTNPFLVRSISSSHRPLSHPATQTSAALLDTPFSFAPPSPNWLLTRPHAPYPFSASKNIPSTIVLLGYLSIATCSRSRSIAGGVGVRKTTEWLYNITSDATIKLSPRAFPIPAGCESKMLSIAGNDDPVNKSISARNFIHASRSFHAPWAALMMSSRLRLARRTIIPPVPSTFPDRITTRSATS